MARTVDSEPWTLDPGPWTLNSGPWTLDTGPFRQGLAHPDRLAEGALSVFDIPPRRNIEADRDKLLVRFPTAA